MNPQPLALEALSTAQLELSRLLCGRQRHFSTLINDSEAELELCIQPTGDLPAYTFHLELNGQPYRFFAGSTLLDDLLPENLDHHGLQKLPDDLQLAVLTHAMTPSLLPISEQLGISWSLRELAATSEDQLSATLGMNIRLKDISTRIELPVDELLLTILSTIPAHHPRQLPDIPFWAALEMGHTQLPADTLTTIETGDIVFMDQHVKGQQVIVRINQRTAFLGEVNGTGISILRGYQTMDEYGQEQEVPPETMEERQEHDGHEMPADDTRVDLNDLPVTLMFEVGQQQLTLAELQNMQAGYVFELDRPIQQPVNIRANGKLIGHCELVQIENRLGARITHLHDQ